MRESGSRPEDRVAVGFVQRRLHGKGAVPIDCRGAAEVRQAFQHQHALTFPGERCASGEPAEARPDDDCIPRSAVIGHRSLSFMAVTSAAPRRGDPHPARLPADQLKGRPEHSLFRCPFYPSESGRKFRASVLQGEQLRLDGAVGA